MFPKRAIQRGLRAALPLAIVLAIMSATGAAAQSPEPAAPSPSPGVIGTGDPRSDGEGPGLVGTPLEIALGVVVIGVLAAGATVLVSRFTRDE